MVFGKLYCGGIYFIGTIVQKELTTTTTRQEYGEPCKLTTVDIETSEISGFPIIFKCKNIYL